MAKQLTDDEASLKRKARRRLIGAVALTTVIVVLLPMLLDSEPRPVGQDIELRIPDKDKVGELVPKIGLSPASAPAAALTAPTPVIADTAVAASQVVAAKVPESKPVPAPKKPDATVPKQAPAKPESKPTEQTQAEPQQGFVVQVGAFTKAESAHYLQKKLSKEGFKVYTEKTGDKTRVRAGPYATREAADKVLRKLEAQGLHPVVSPVQ
ncbi:MAG: SPOR domain-containing protein [Betaproteobacteria bacterium]|nr:SPOR domain-containing protein [Betaproteobacteria bacterium]